MLNEGYGDAFFVRQYARQMTCEMTHFACQRGFPLCVAGVSDVEPAPGDCLASLQQFGSCRVVEGTYCPYLAGDVDNALAYRGGTLFSGEAEVARKIVAMGRSSEESMGE